MPEIPRTRGIRNKKISVHPLKKFGGPWRISFVVFLLYPAAIVVRIRNEEKVLEEGLAGYTEYNKDGEVSIDTVHMVKRF